MAASLATANETDNMALAPKLLLFSVPSIFIISSSIFDCSRTSKPSSFLLNISLTLDTAFVTCLPLKAFPPSLSSSASKTPVDAPEGTAALAYFFPT